MLIQRCQRIIELLGTPGALRALVSWPRFSLAAYSIVRRMQHAGVAPRTIIDVGANEGQFAIAASRLFAGAAITSIEPDPRVAARLGATLRREPRARVVVTAVGERAGEALFNVNSDSQVSSMLPLAKDRLESYPDSCVVDRIRVPVASLDDLFEGQALEQPILLKIDVQGFEDRVVAGATTLLGQVTWVLMEVSFSRLYEGERDFATIVALMRACGFEFVRPVNFHVSPVSGEIIEMDALFKRTAVRESLEKIA